MRIKVFTPLIIIGFFVALAFSFTVLASIDAPHNESNNVSCGSCHDEGLLNSPFWGGSGSYDRICTDRCHSPQQSCPFSDSYAPLVKTHVDSVENALAECRTCHDPHYQKQKNYKNTDESNLYLAYGTIISCRYDPPVHPETVGTSTLTYSSMTYKTGWDVAKLTGKTDTCRRTILFPNVKKLGYSYPIIAIAEDTPTTGTITVKGDARPVYQYIFSSDFAVMYGQYIKDSINGRQVKLFDQVGPGSYADGDGAYNGVCEVCHTQTMYHRNNGTDARHFATSRCIPCHTHINGLVNSGGEGPSHPTHVDDGKGPHSTCSECHDTTMFPYFKSGTDGNGDEKYELSETDVCDTCHSPGGSFNGVISVEGSIGAKTNWVGGVYQEDGTLTIEKEKWCVGCHDNVPAVVNGQPAPDICGDYNPNTSLGNYGYYLGAHGNETYGVNRQGVSYSQGECVHCHEVNVADPSHGGELFGVYTPTTQTDNFCFECHKGTSSVQEGGIINYLYSKTFGGESADHGITSMYDACNADASGGSSHDLSALLAWAETNHPEWGFTSSSNPCTICHNVHTGKANWRNPQDPTYTTLRRSSEHASNPGNLWGDNTGETMDSIWSAYRPPYYKSIGSNGYEPGGTSDHVGTKHPDYSTLCLDCHTEKSVNGRSGIDWRDELPRPDDTWAPIHGEFPTNSTNFHPESYFGDLKLPWDSSNDYVLSCLDCHEPHGSSNPHMLRTMVNGVSGLTYDRDDNSSVQAWCEACHVLNTITQDQEDFCRACHAIGAPGSVAEVYDNGSPFHFSFVSKPKCIDCHTHAPNIVIGPHGDYEPDSDVCSGCHRTGP